MSWIDAVTPEWLTDAMAVDGAVQGVETAPMDVASAAGELARLTLTYEPASAGPATVIAKAPGTGEIQQAMNAAMGLFSRERYVYAEVADALPVRLPRCYYAGDEQRQAPTLLEDLAHLRMGDQVAGLTQTDAERLVDVMAEMHVAFWETDPPGGDAGCLVSWADPTFAAMLTQLVTSGVGTLRQLYEGRVATGVLDAIEQAAPDWGKVLLRCSEGPQTFVHNDFRLDNVFFEPDGTPVVIDWQLAGRCRGTQDLAYLLSGSMAIDALRDAWEPLVARYHERLLAGGVTDYDLDECRFHYRQSLLYTVAPGIAMLGQMALAGGDERGLADTLVLRTLTHAAELDAFATL